MDTATEVKDMWCTEVRHLVEELELRENRANHIDRASMIREIIERFETVVGNAANIPANRSRSSTVESVVGHST